ncbi:CDK5 regulatory subunit-associated protein 2 isoform X2 [Megalops cyprinoides]|uniref:CDK5 regulatory subunit-associated protein 2 isoform X2 n=1 Tax=Megalops cyprinoides TaxID=118141 RepID=UPI001864DCF0|nr:CDK5 regulatory subunit-associated protein 2 isoform X2 [Megalops cyprinoides]
MDSVEGEDQTLPLDINGSTMSRLPDAELVGDRGGIAVEPVTASMFHGEKMSPTKALTMKDYENQITGLKKENFNLKLRIYFLEERMQQKFDDSTEDIFKTNIELKVEVESLKRELAEKQELLVSASKALESLAGKESGEASRAKEQAQREADQLRDFFNKRIQQLEESLKAAEGEAEKMAAIAEQEKMRNIDMEKKLLTFGLSGTFTPAPPQDLHHALQEKNSVIEQLRLSLKNQDAVIEQLRKNCPDQGSGDLPTSEQVRQLSALMGQRDRELQALREELQRERVKNEKEIQSFVDKQNEVARLEAATKQLSEELNSTKGAIQNLSKTLEDTENQNKMLSGKLEERERELASEKKNALKRDKTIQGLSLALKEKDKEIEELCREMEGKDEALAKARQAVRKAQMQKNQGVEEHQSLLTVRQEELMNLEAELANLQAEHHKKVLEAQKLQRALGRQEQEQRCLQEAKEQLQQELDDLYQLKRKGDKAINHLTNQLKKLSEGVGESEGALEQLYQALLEESKCKIQGHELTIQRLTSSLSEKEQQLQEYMNMINENRGPAGGDTMLAKLRERLKEKEKALEQAIDEKFAAVEEKDNEIRQLQLSLREKERDLERLKNLLSHNEETINSLDTLMKEKDVELQHQVSSFKNLQRAKEELEENLARALREKESIISQLQHTLEAKTKDLENMANTLVSQTQSNARDVAEQLNQRLKVAETRLSEALKDKERLVSDNQSATEGLLATIGSKDQLLKESAEHYNRMLSECAQEILELKRQLSEKQQQLSSAERQSLMTTQEKYLETTELKVLLSQKDTEISKLVESGQERERFLAELKLMETPVPQVVELRQTIQVLQERLEEKEAQRSKKNNDDDTGKIPVTERTAVLLKKELEQKTEAMNHALKRENELKIELAELRSSVMDLESQIEAQAASIESLTATLETKDDIIWDLHERLGKQGESKVCDLQTEGSEPTEERPRPGLPQRERTIIGGNSQQEALPTLAALLSEQERLKQALKAEQQLYASLVRAVKEQDSAQCLHTLQMELAAVQLLRQQLEEGVQSNEDLRQDLERELQCAKQREGRESKTEPIDPKEVESMRHQLEDAQRWNASLQARLGAIQSRGGGVGGTNDTVDTFSFMADQTSYMSICMGDGLDELGLLSAAELRQKVVELQDYIKELEALNAELQKSTSLAVRSAKDLTEKEEESDLKLASEEEHYERKLEEPVCSNKAHHSLLDRESQSHADKQGRRQWDDANSLVSDGERVGELLDVTLGGTASTSHFQRGAGQLKRTSKNKHGSSQEDHDREMGQLRLLLSDTGASSVTHLREELQRLQAENIDLKGYLKEKKSTETKETADTSGDSDSNRDLQKVVDKLRSEAKSYRKIVKLLKEQLELNLSADGKAGFNPELIVGMAKEIERLKVELEAYRRQAESLENLLEMEAQEQQHQQQESEHTLRNAYGKDTSPKKRQRPDIERPVTGVRSRLPVPTRARKMISSNKAGANQRSCRESQLLREETHQIGKNQLHPPPGLQDLDQWGRVDPDKLGPLCPDSEWCAGGDLQAGSGTVRQSEDAELHNQLELLHGKCQEKERVIARLEEQAAECEELREKLQEKETLNQQLDEALQAAGSTIAYLTACSLDSESGRVQGSEGKLQQQCDELQKALEEKEELYQQLVKCLRVAESATASLGAFVSDTAARDTQTSCADPRELVHKLENAIQQMNRSSVTEEGTEIVDPRSTDLDLHRQIDQLQEALWEQSRQNAELQERLRYAELSTALNSDRGTAASRDLDTNQPRQVEESPRGGEEHQERNGQLEAAEGKRKQLQESPEKPHEDPHRPEQLIRRLAECLQAAEWAVASLAAYCTYSTNTDRQRGQADFQQQLERLQKALQEKNKLQDQYLGESNELNIKGVGHQNKNLDLKENIGCLQRALIESSQKISDLQKAIEEQKRLIGDSEEQLKTVSLSTAKLLKNDNVHEQVEALQNALKEKKNVCKMLEEKLAAAQTAIALQTTAQKTHGAAQQTTSLEQDHKEVQVDLQDLGYETSGKSENEVDREENSSTDIDRGLHASELSLPSLLKQVRGAFSSLENLESTSSVSYPSSPTLSSPKVSLQAFEDYGLTDDPERLRQQVVELKGHLESHQRAVRHLQDLLRRNSLSSELLTAASQPDHLAATQGKNDTGLGESCRHKLSPEALHGDFSQSSPLSQEEEERQVMKDQITNLHLELERERSLNRNLTEQLQQVQFRSQSASPARIDSLVQSQARELSQLRQQIKESRGLGSLQRQQLEDLSKAFEELLQASDVDYYMGEVFREQLDKSLTLLDRLEDRLENGEVHSDNEDGIVLEVAQRLSRELQDKNRLVQSLQQQLQAHSSCSHHSSDSDITDRVTSSRLKGMNGVAAAEALEHPATDAAPGAGAQDSSTCQTAIPGGTERDPQLHSLQRENSRLLEQLRSSEQLNETLRSELDLQRSILVQRDGADRTREREVGREEQDSSRAPGRTMNPDVLAEHLQEIRSLRLRLEESIRTNDRLREQLERKLAELEKDPATNIFIHGAEEQGQLANEVRFLWGQNQALKEQLSLGSRDKQKENEKLRESLARKTAKLEYLRNESETLRKESGCLQSRLTNAMEDNKHLQDSLHYSRDEIHRLQCEINVQRQQLMDNHQLLQSLRVELQVYEQIKTAADKQTVSELAQDASNPGSGALDLSELLSEIRHLRVQLERSIHTNNALRQKLEEQLQRGVARPEGSHSTILINYLPPREARSGDDGTKSPTHNGLDTSPQGRESSSVLHEAKRQMRRDLDYVSQCSGSSADSTTPTPSRLVPGHHVWANKNGCHVLGLIEDYSALRKQISEGRRLTSGMDKHLQECIHTLSQQDSESKDQQLLKGFSTNINTIQQVLEEASRLLKLLWRVSLPATTSVDGTQSHQDDLLKNEIARLKSRLSQQERMLAGAVKRLRTTNRLKEGMEKIIIDQLSLTHGVLKKARGNLEQSQTNYFTLFGLKGLPGPIEGTSLWTVTHGGNHHEMCVQELCRTLGVA